MKCLNLNVSRQVPGLPTPSFPKHMGMFRFRKEICVSLALPNLPISFFSRSQKCLFLCEISRS